VWMHGDGTGWILGGGEGYFRWFNWVLGRELEFQSVYVVFVDRVIVEYLDV